MNSHVTFITPQGRVLLVWSGPITDVYPNMPSGSLCVQGHPPAVDNWKFDLVESQWVELTFEGGAA